MEIPYHLITYSNNCIAIVYSNKVKAKNLSTNEIIQFNSDDMNKTKIRAVAFNNDSSIFVSASDDKELKCWDVKTGKCLFTKNTPKKVNSITFENNGNKFLIADGFGDVYRYSIDNSIEKGELMMGHVSMLTDILISNDDKYLITSDRDEKIRVTEYPKTYNIHNFCFGHKEYISKLHFLPNHKELLLSGGGDENLFLWNFEKAEIVQKIDIKSIIQDTIKKNNLEPVNSYNVVEISSCEKENLVAVCFERVPVILIFEEQNKLLKLKNTIVHKHIILDMTFDNKGQIWINNFVKNKEDKLVSVIKNFSPVEYVSESELEFFEKTEECDSIDESKYLVVENLRKNFLGDEEKKSKKNKERIKK